MIRGLLNDEEWAFFEPFVTSKTGRPIEYRLTLDGTFWATLTGAPWRDLPEEFGKWNSVYRQFRRWSLSGLWDWLPHALASSGAVPKTVQMTDSTVVRAHHHAAGAKTGLKRKVLAVCAEALQVKFMLTRTARASHSASSSRRAKHMTQQLTMN